MDTQGLAAYAADQMDILRNPKRRDELVKQIDKVTPFGGNIKLVKGMSIPALSKFADETGSRLGLAKMLSKMGNDISAKGALRDNDALYEVGAQIANRGMREMKKPVKIFD
jgi:hypothetical protein